MVNTRENQQIKKWIETIDYHQIDLISEFGKQAMTQINLATDQLLHQLRSALIQSSEVLFEQLQQLLEQCNPDDFQVKRSNVLRKFWLKKSNTQQLYQKYQQLGVEIDRVYLNVIAHQQELKQSLWQLEQVYQLSQAGLTQLIFICERIEHLLLHWQKLPLNPHQPFEQAALGYALERLEQRLVECQCHQTIAQANMKQIRMIQQTNNYVIQVIESAFVVLVPTFKQVMLEAMSEQHEQMQTQALKALNHRIEQEYAQYHGQQSQGVGQKVIQQTQTRADHLEASWQLIEQGIQQARKLEQQRYMTYQQSQIAIQQIQGGTE
ncbi:MAG: toxic anion resistance protein [Culicoidibacterales bacterium]